MTEMTIFSRGECQRRAFYALGTSAAGYWVVSHWLSLKIFSTPASPATRRWIKEYYVSFELRRQEDKVEMVYLLQLEWAV